MKLWYKTAATEWENGLPIGTGRLEAMVLGDATAAVHPDLEQMIFEMYGVHYGFVRKADDVDLVEQ